MFLIFIKTNHKSIFHKNIKLCRTEFFFFLQLLEIIPGRYISMMVLQNKFITD